ncbi:alpha/beta hydrolase [Kitasatospora nipponensis]|uniref:Alpha/beta hydrolase n=1 Tax=Kitasatospora nipponensis TaxID=258049 RepID=A0ABP4GJY5_9ACTN
MTTTHTLTTADADIAYDLHGPPPSADGVRPLVMIGQPMTAEGFTALAFYFPDRPVVTYDPRGLGRSVRKDGRVDNDPAVQAADLHALVVELGVGPVDVFASSGGAVTALAWVTTHPEDIVVLVDHEPPLLSVLPDAAAAERGFERIRDAYDAGGFGPGMAAFIGYTSWQGEITDEFLAQPLPDPAQFGMQMPDDGARDSPLLSDRSWAIIRYQPDIEALRAAPTRIVTAVGEESAGVLTDRTSRALAALLGQEVVVFPSHHGGFQDASGGYPGQPEAFAKTLREVLAADGVPDGGAGR